MEQNKRLERTPLNSHNRAYLEMISFGARRHERDKILIGLVKEHPDLWDMTSPTYNRDDPQLWQQVTGKMNNICLDRPDLGASIDSKVNGTFYTCRNLKAIWSGRIAGQHLAGLLHSIQNEDRVPLLEELTLSGFHYTCTSFWDEMRFVREMWERFACDPASKLGHRRAVTIREEKLFGILRRARAVGGAIYGPVVANLGEVIAPQVTPSDAWSRCSAAYETFEKMSTDERSLPSVGEVSTSVQNSDSGPPATAIPSKPSGGPDSKQTGNIFSRYLLYEREKALIGVVKEYPALWDKTDPAKASIAQWNEVARKLNLILSERPDFTSTEKRDNFRFTDQSALDLFRQLTARLVEQMIKENSGHPISSVDRFWVHWDEMKFVRNKWTLSQIHFCVDHDNADQNDVPMEETSKKASKLSQQPSTSYIKLPESYSERLRAQETEKSKRRPQLLFDPKEELIEEDKPRNVEFDAGCDTLDLNTVFGSNHPAMDMSENTAVDCNEITVKEDPGCNTMAGQRPPSASHGGFNEAESIPELSPQPSHIEESESELQGQTVSNHTSTLDSLKERIRQLYETKPNIAKKREAELLKFLMKCEDDLRS